MKSKPGELHVYQAKHLFDTSVDCVRFPSDVGARRCSDVFVHVLN